ncbi:MAG: response regulator receiver protein [Devosia sp.]|uniref:response regulator n=1 Tax=Devosia sp. TaxID=1871048 RepID=UPI002628AB72|nr:response regulator [Devosia sp.]MDB5585936.1 response regulator receiver protein [Devosia sp.]
MPFNGPLPAILVVEDEFLILSATAYDLRDAGFTVFEASNADDAIELLEAHGEIRILFTDVDMPGSMDGLKLSAAVRERWPPTLIIVTSGKTLVGRAKLPVGGRFFPKPYSTGKIASAMQEMLA